MTRTLTYSGSLVTVTCWCGIRHAVPSELRNYQLRAFNDGKSVTGIYCPLGHAHIPSGKTEAERLRKELADEREWRGRMAAQRDQAEASARAYKGAATKARKRSAAAVCPCCSRSFVQLRRHMASKHPDYDPTVA